MDYLLAVDCGSQSAKVAVIDTDGTVHAFAQQPLRPYAMPEPGQVVHPDDDLFDALCAASRRALAQFAGDPRRIIAVGLCSIRFCRAVLDSEGALVQPLMSWMDERVAAPHPAYGPDVACVTTSSGYLTHRLTGRFRDTRANYEGQWPLDHDTGEWSTDPEAYAAAGVPRRLLPELRSPGDRLGEITPAAQRATSIPAGIPVYATANDKAVEALGAGLTGPGGIVISLGTYVTAMTVATESHPPEARFWANAGAIPGTRLYESRGIRRGMWTASWFRELAFGPGAGGDSTDSRSAEEVLAAEAARVSPGCGGLMTLLDWLAPEEEPHRRGAFIGFDGTQGRGHVYRSILEGMAMTMRSHVQAMEDALGTRFSTITVTGGGARSDVMMRIVAGVFGRPACRAGFTDAAGLGAAVCAAVGAGAHRDFRTAVTRMVGRDTFFHAGAREQAAYELCYRRYGRMRDGIGRVLAEVAHRDEM